MTQRLQNILPRIQALDASRHASAYIAFLVAGECVGQVHKGLLKDLLDAKGEGGCIFGLVRSEFGEAALDLDAARFATYESRTAALQVAVDELVRKGRLKKLHVEAYSVCAGWGKPALCEINRNAAAMFGICSPGVHLVCYCVDDEGSMRFWLAQRSASKSSYPLLYDPIAAGGQPVGLSLQSNMEKEAAEEAGITQELARKARSAGVLSQTTSNEDGTGLKQSVYFVWDLQVGSSFRPSAQDGEVEGFELWTLEDLLHDLQFGFKVRPSQRMVFVDFLMRHGLLTPDEEPDYVELTCAMHQPRLALYPQRPANIEAPTLEL